MKYYGGEETGVVAMPIAQFTSPTDGHVVTYNATNDEFELAEAGGGGAGVTGTSTVSSTSTTSTTWGDVTGASVTLNVSANSKIFMLFTGHYSISTGSVQFRWHIDGTGQSQQVDLNNGTQPTPFSLSFLSGTLSSGNRTVKLQWQVSSHGGTAKVSEGYNVGSNTGQMQAMEFLA
jgi:hypothetical protein